MYKIFDIIIFICYYVKYIIQRGSMDFKEFGEHLSFLRKQNRISQEQMAKDLRISRATISSFENGKASDIGFKKVLQIVDYLDFELSVKEKSAFPTFEELRDAR